MKGFENQILGEGYYTNTKEQALHDEHTLSLWHTAALNAWDRIQELGKRFELYARFKQGQREPFRTFYKD